MMTGIFPKGLIFKYSGLKNYQNLSRWYQEISEREAVVKGYAFMDKEAKIPKV